MQYLGIDKKIIPYAIERTRKLVQKLLELIFKLYEKQVENFQPDYKLVLPWHFKKNNIKRKSISVMEDL